MTRCQHDRTLDCLDPTACETSSESLSDQASEDLDGPMHLRCPYGQFLCMPLIVSHESSSSRPETSNFLRGSSSWFVSPDFWTAQKKKTLDSELP